MTKRITAILFLLVYLAFLSLSPTNDGKNSSKQEVMFQFPTSLKYIEKEAFWDTAVEIIAFPEGFLCLEDNAFAENTHLKKIILPSTTIYIADSAFVVTAETVIYGDWGSYVQDWARKHGASFAYENLWSSILDNVKKVGNYIEQIQDLFHALLATMFFNSVITGQDMGKSRRPQDRPELNPIDYRFP